MKLNNIQLRKILHSNYNDLHGLVREAAYYLPREEMVQLYYTLWYLLDYVQDDEEMVILDILDCMTGYCVRAHYIGTGDYDK